MTHYDRSKSWNWSESLFSMSGIETEISSLTSARSKLLWCWGAALPHDDEVEISEGLKDLQPSFGRPANTIIALFKMRWVTVCRLAQESDAAFAEGAGASAKAARLSLGLHVCHTFSCSAFNSGWNFMPSAQNDNEYQQICITGFADFKLESNINVRP